jgi:Tat protein secretion system quality control protein TatD with DNase activity
MEERPDNAAGAPFPWELGVFDAHCHPTDQMASIDDIPAMKARTLAIMATRAEDQELVSQVAARLNGSEKRVHPCFGWHPWFSHQIIDDTTSASTMSKEEHYKAVLTPSPEDKDFIHSLPKPRLLSSLISDIRSNLERHPEALVGEVGLDKAFRLPNAWAPHELEKRDASLTCGSREGRSLSPYRVQLSHQRAVLKAQLQLAGELRRPVSIHSVQTHGKVFELLRELWAGHEKRVASNRERKRRVSAAGAHEGSEDESEEPMDKPRTSAPLPFPPKICMHSYSGPAEPLKQFLHRSTPADVYFSFSHVINFSGDSLAKITEVVKAVPENRILVESDLHCAGVEMDNLLEDAIRRICSICGWTLEAGVRILGENWREFISG